MVKCICCRVTLLWMVPVPSPPPGIGRTGKARIGGAASIAAAVVLAVLPDAAAISAAGWKRLPSLREKFRGYCMRFDGLGRAASSRSRTESSGRCVLGGRLLSRRAAIASVIGLGSLALLSACGRTAPEPVDAFSGGTERSVFAWRDGQSPLDLPPEEVVAPVRPISPPPRAVRWS